MSFSPVTIIEPVNAPAPLVVDSPHSGRVYPADFIYTCPLAWLRQTEDFLVDELVASAVEAGATAITAEFPRSYIDANRAEDDIDPAVLAGAWPRPLNPSERTLLGLGLVRRLCKSGVPVYAAPLPIEIVQQRIEACYRPYHAALEKAVAKRMQDFGACWLIDVHSMPGRSHENRGGLRPDFVLGDRQGTSCDPAFTSLVRDGLQERGYSVALNDPYKGMEITRRYGQPHKGQHALQIEINRRLYVNEATLEKNENFGNLRRDLAGLFRDIATFLIADVRTPIAAE